MQQDKYSDITVHIEQLFRDDATGTALARVCRLLKDRVDHFDWVGFYIAVPAEKALVLGPFEGAPTEHLRIPYGRGVCGQSALREEALLVQDVASESNYLACSLQTRSEIVVPVFAEGAYVGQIDVDSHTVNAFTDEDRALLERVVALSQSQVADLSRHLSQE